jgi:hypothetical protein
LKSAAITDTKTPITIATVVQSMPKKNDSTTVPSGEELMVVFGKAYRLSRGSYLIGINDANSWAGGGVRSHQR